MKRLFSFFILVSATGCFQACLDKDSEEEFRFDSTVYVVQLGEREFKLVAGAVGRNGEIDPSTSTITLGTRTLDTESYHANYIETTGVFPTLSELAGLYEFNLTDKQGRENYLFARLEQLQEPGDFGYTDYQYSDGNVEFQIKEEASNATLYGFYQRPIPEDELDPSWLTCRYAAKPLDATGHVSVAVISTATDSMVYPAAFIMSSNVVKVIRIDQAGGKLLKGGASSFSD